MKTASAKEINAPVSVKSSLIIGKEIKNKKIDKAEMFLNDLISEKKSVNRRYYKNAAKKLLEILKSAKANAKNKTMDIERLFIKNVIINKGEKRFLPKTRFKLRGRTAKTANIEIILEER